MNLSALGNATPTDRTIGRPLGILLIENDPAEVRLFFEILKQARLLSEVNVVADAPEAMAYLERTTEHQHRPMPDLILLDPDLCDRELLDQLRKLAGLAHIPVVALCKSDVQIDPPGASFMRAIRKPIDLDQFLLVLHSIERFWINIVALPRRTLSTALDTLQLLLVEDDLEDVDLLVKCLADAVQPAFMVTHANTLSAARDALREHYAVVLFNLNLPDSQGLETAASMLSLAPFTPQVVLSDVHNEALAMHAVTMGVQDYVVKSGAMVGNLPQTIRYAIERWQIQKKLHYFSSHDSVTGLPNRQLFLDSLAHLLDHSRRWSSIAVVMCIGLNEFGAITVGYGHEAGNIVIKTIADRMRRLLPNDVLLACIGVGEFALSMSIPRDNTDVMMLAEQLLDGIHQPCRVGDQEFLPNAIVGLSFFSADAEDAVALLKCAEIAMHQAQNRESVRVHFYSGEIAVHMRKRLSLERELRRGLEHGELQLHYQPICRIADQALVGFEALLRWQHPEHGLVSPQAFLPAAEESNLIVPIGDWVLRTACRQARAWGLVDRTQFRIAVNMSARQFEGTDLIGYMDQLLVESGLDPRVLELELTESVMHRPESRSVLAALRDFGISIAIDDFGTGFSSLAYLKAFPVDVLKIDRSFITEAVNDLRDGAIVRAIVAMAHSLGIEVVAEGVETKAQLRFLRQQNCDRAQGYFFGAPEDVATATSRLQASRDLARDLLAEE